ncbi:MAG: zf-HC2 domain-containing protein, partial [Blastocatellia bacterium]
MSHISDQQIEQYRARSAGPEEILSIDDHLFTCGFCLQRLKSASGRLESGNVAIGLSPDDDDDPLYAQVESYVDDALPPSEREYFEKHMLECRTCREEVRDLLSFKAALHETVPGAAVTELDSVTVSGVAATASGAWNSRLFWFGAYAALLILAVTGVWLLNASQRKQMRALEAEVEALQQANKTLAQRTGQISQLNDRLNNIEESGSSLAASIELHDGERIINLRGGVLEGLDGVSARSQTAVKAALTEGKARVPSLKELESRVSVLMGGSDTAVSFSIKHPVGVVIEDTQPVFEWDPLDGAISYTVAIQSAKSKQVWTSPPITDT